MDCFRRRKKKEKSLGNCNKKKNTGNAVCYKNHDQRMLIWMFCNISTKRPQATLIPVCNQTPPGCCIIHKKKQIPLLRSQKQKNSARLVLYFEAKLGTENFDAANTAESENKIQTSAIFHSNTLVCSENAFR